MTKRESDNIENATSNLLDAAYEDALELIARAADYIEGARRSGVSAPAANAAYAYSVESMRLVTRLMQAMAWLLVQRAVENGELSRDQAAAPERRLGAREVCLGGPVEGAHGLPQTFQLLLTKSEILYRRIERLDAAIDARASNPVHTLVSRIASIE